MNRAVSVFTFLVFLLGALILLWLWDATGARRLAANLLGWYLLGWAGLFFFSDTPRGERHLRFTLMTSALLLLLATLEALAVTGVVDFQSVFGNRTDAWWRGSWNEFDPELLWKKRPFLEDSGSAKGNIAALSCLPASHFPEHPYHVRFDRNGFRNEEDLTTAPIIVAGDSYIEANAVSYDSTFTSQLTKLSGAPVGNLGTSGYGPQQYLTVTERFAPELRPEVIVWAFYEGNDLEDIGRVDRLFRELGTGSLQPEPTFRERSFTRNALIALDRLLESCDGSVDRQVGLFRAADGEEVSMYFLDFAPPVWKDELTALEMLEPILGRAYEVAVQNGARFVLVYVPVKFRVYGDLVEIPESSRLRTRPPSDLPARVDSIVRSVSPEIGFIDLTPAFVAAASEGEVLYFPDDTHWTAAGHRRAAEAVWAWLSEVEGSLSDEVAKP